MYKIIGIDGRQYGPVTADQVKEWIAAGRANAQTKAQLEGEADWRPLSAFVEFAEALAAKTAAIALPDVPPRARATDAASLEKSTASTGPNIDVGSCLGRAWDKLMSDLWPIVGITALVWLALSASHALYVGVIITGPLLGGLYFYYLKKIRGQPAELQDAFAGFTLSFVPLLLASLVSTVLIALGLALCIIPGVYLAVAWCFALPLIIDKQLDFWRAMELSRKVLYERWWSMAWLLLVCVLINLGGGLLCCVRIFFTLPLTMLAVTYAYEDVFRTQTIKSA